MTLFNCLSYADNLLETPGTVSLCRLGENLENALFQVCHSPILKVKVDELQYIHGNAIGTKFCFYKVMLQGTECLL